MYLDLVCTAIKLCRVKSHFLGKVRKCLMCALFAQRVLEFPTRFQIEKVYFHKDILYLQ